MEIKITVIFVPAGNIGYKEVFDKTDPVPRLKPKKNSLSPDTQTRCNRAITLYRELGPLNFILTSGGLFMPPTLQDRAAAALMKDYLTFYKIPADNIFTEEKSLDSWQNVEFMVQVLASHNFDISQVELIIVSHWLHTIRLQRLCRYYGNFKKVSRCPLYYPPIGKRGVLKELLLILLTLIDPAGKSFIVKRERRRRQILAAGNIIL